MTNGERADRLLAEAQAVAGELSDAIAGGRWNLATRRAQEIVELVVKGLLNEMGTEYPRAHDVVPTFVDTTRQRGLEVDPAFLDWLRALSSRLTELRGPAFYHEIGMAEAEARAAAAGAERVLVFGRDFLGRLRAG